MAYKIVLNQNLAHERRRIATEQIDKALDELDNDSLDVHTRVHQFRKRAKKVRALTRLFRPVDEAWYKAENARFRDLARRYSDLRDAQAATETLDAVTGYFSAQLIDQEFLEIGDYLRRLREHSRARDTCGERLPSLRQDLLEARDHVSAWPDAAVEVDAVIAGFGKTYNRARKACKRLDAASAASAWHEWRKRVKYHRYHCKLLRELWPPVIDCWRRELKRLTTRLGDDHDLAELDALLAADDDIAGDRAVEALRGLMLQRSRSLRQAAHPLGQRLFVDKPGHMKVRLETLWKTAA